MKTFFTALALFFLYFLSVAQDNCGNECQMLDETFGKKGRVVTVHDTSIYQRSSIKSLVLQRDGKILASGNIITKKDNRTIIGIVRYMKDGKIDVGFGTNGFVYSDLSNQTAYLGFDAVTDMQLQSDGKIIILSERFSNDSTNFALLRYNSDGSVDSAFGKKGILSLPYPDYTSILIDSFDNIIVSGRDRIAQNSLLELFVLSKYLKNGNIDVNFGTGGSAVFNFGPTYDFNGPKIIWDKKGNIVMAGLTYYSRNIIVGRFYSNGKIDSSFSNKGWTEINSSTIMIFFGDVTAQENNKIIIGGTGSVDYFSDDDMSIGRLKENGELDNNFGRKGYVITDFTSNPRFTSYDELVSVMVQGDGKIIAAGMGITNSLNGKFVLARYNKDGTLDSTYGIGGLVKTTIEPGNDLGMYDAVLQPDGKVIAAGAVSVSDEYTDGNFLLIRYNKEKTGTMLVNASHNTQSLLKTIKPSVYPNPVNNILFIKGFNMEGNGEITLINNLGSIVAKKAVSINNNMSLNIQSFPSGVYYAQVSITGKKDVFTFKFIKH